MMKRAKDFLIKLGLAALILFGIAMPCIYGFGPDTRLCYDDKPHGWSEWEDIGVSRTLLGDRIVRKRKCPACTLTQIAK